MDFTETIAVLISGIFSLTMANSLVVIAPVSEMIVNAVLICIHQGFWSYNRSQKRFNGFLFNVGKHENGDIPRSLNNSENRRFFLFKSSSPRSTLERCAPWCTPFLTNFFRMSFMPGNYVYFVALYDPADLTSRLPCGDFAP